MGLTDVWRDIDFYKETRIHPTQKPISLIKRLISASSNEGDLILDPFGGSASTAISCRLLNRKYISIEIDEKYFNASLARLETLENPLKNMTIV
jgi:site-specific DNA-methyltransferase (adenine-specific)